MPLSFMLVGSGFRCNCFEHTGKVNEKAGFVLKRSQCRCGPGDELKGNLVHDISFRYNGLNLFCNVKDFALVVRVKIERVRLDRHASVRLAREAIKSVRWSQDELPCPRPLL